MNREVLNLNAQIKIEKKQRKKINKMHIQNGVRFIDPKQAYIDASVKIGRGTVIYPGVILSGGTQIGNNCQIMQNCRIEDSKIGDNSVVQSSVIVDSSVGANTNIGPFAYLRPNSKIGDNCKVGDFVEIKNTVVGNGTKIPHLAYIGDGEVGEKTNIACGVIFVNYDGKNKNKTKIGDNCFIGCNANLIAPVNIANGAYIAAGSTVVSDVPENSLCIARERQTIKEDWVKPKDR